MFFAEFIEIIQTQNQRPNNIEGVNKGIKSADPYLFSPNLSIRQSFCSNPKPQLHQETEV